jgi:tryptophan synthase alpha chain
MTYTRGSARIEAAMRKGRSKKLAVFCTAGFPEADDTGRVILALSQAGVDLIEIGVPFSDSLVDGPTIQTSNERALHNGMTLKKLLAQVRAVRERTAVPLILMSAFNPILQFPVEQFLREAAEAGVDGAIIPDLPVEVYLESYRPAFQQSGLPLIFLITARTEPQRIRYLDTLTGGILYVVSAEAVTGTDAALDSTHECFFEKLGKMGLGSRLLAGFGISDRPSFERATRYLDGAVIGSAFIRALLEPGELEEKAARFVRSIR